MRPYNDISVNDEQHIGQWFHKVIMEPKSPITNEFTVILTYYPHVCCDAGVNRPTVNRQGGNEMATALPVLYKYSTYNCSSGLCHLGLFKCLYNVGT